MIIPFDSENYLSFIEKAIISMGCKQNHTLILTK